MTSAATTMTAMAMPALAPVERPCDLCSTTALVGRALLVDVAVVIDELVPLPKPIQMPDPAVFVAQSSPKPQQCPPKDEGHPYWEPLQERPAQMSDTVVVVMAARFALAVMVVVTVSLA